jgi:hypothetical protein
MARVVALRCAATSDASRCCLPSMIACSGCRQGTREAAVLPARRRGEGLTPTRDVTARQGHDQPPEKIAEGLHGPRTSEVLLGLMTFISKRVLGPHAAPSYPRYDRLVLFGSLM